MFGVVPPWVNDGATWATLISGAFAVIGSIWVVTKITTRRAAKAFTGAVVEVVERRVPAIVENVLEEKLEEKLTPIRDKQDKVVADVNEIREQMHPNGGNSLRDRVNTLTDAAGVAPGYYDPARTVDPV